MYVVVSSANRPGTHSFSACVSAGLHFWMAAKCMQRARHRSVSCLESARRSAPSGCFVTCTLLVWSLRMWRLETFEATRTHAGRVFRWLHRGYLPLTAMISVPLSRCCLSHEHYRVHRDSAVQVRCVTSSGQPCYLIEVPGIALWIEFCTRC